MSRETQKAIRDRKSAELNARSPYREGDLVLCVDDSQTQLVTKGNKYRVHAVDRTMLVLKMVNPGFLGLQHMSESRFVRARRRKWE